MLMIVHNSVSHTCIAQNAHKKPQNAISSLLLEATQIRLSTSFTLPIACECSSNNRISALRSVAKAVSREKRGNVANRDHKLEHFQSFVTAGPDLTAVIWSQWRQDYPVSWCCRVYTPNSSAPLLIIPFPSLLLTAPPWTTFISMTCNSIPGITIPQIQVD